MDCHWSGIDFGAISLVLTADATPVGLLNWLSLRAESCEEIRFVLTAKVVALDLVAIANKFLLVVSLFS